MKVDFSRINGQQAPEISRQVFASPENALFKMAQDKKVYPSQKNKEIIARLMAPWVILGAYFCLICLITILHSP